eukprot:7351529-Karenia_brevis.AAC.1
MFLANPTPLEAGPPENADPDDEFDYKHGTDSEGDYDMTVYGDDGQKPVDDNGQPMIPFDPKLEYDEGSA